MVWLTKKYIENSEPSFVVIQRRDAIASASLTLFLAFHPDPSMEIALFLTADHLLSSTPRIYINPYQLLYLRNAPSWKKNKQT